MIRSGWLGMLRSKGPEMFIEAFFVVFAVLVALAVDEWSQEREEQERADQARAAVLSEIRANHGELQTGHASTVNMLERATDIVRRMEGGEDLVQADLSGELPDFSDAAWETARVTGSVARMPYDWMVMTARVYEAQDLTWSLQRDFIMSIGALVAHGPEEDRFRDLQGQLMILVGLQEELLGKYEDLLAHS